MFIQARDGTPPRPLTPAGLAIGAMNSAGGGAIKPLSPDSRQLLVYDREKHPWLFPLDSTNPQPKPADGVLPGERPAGWSRDGQHLYVYAMPLVPVKIYDVDLKSGQRRLLHEYAAENVEGVFRLGPFLLMPDGHSFAYGNTRQISTLYTATGLH
jgi:hypothetical protein